MYARALQFEIYAKRTAALFAAIIALSAFLYGAFLLIAVQRTAVRADAGSKIQALATELGELQSQYLGKTADLTPSRAVALGFVKPSTSAIVYAEVSEGALSFAHGGR